MEWSGCRYAQALGPSPPRPQAMGGGGGVTRCMSHAPRCAPESSRAALSRAPAHTCGTARLTAKRACCSAERNADLWRNAETRAKGAARKEGREMVPNASFRGRVWGGNVTEGLSGMTSVASPPCTRTGAVCINICIPPLAGRGLTHKRLIPPHPAQTRHTNDWAPRTRKRHRQEHRPQQPTERSHLTQYAKGRTGEAATRRGRRREERATVQGPGRRPQRTATAHRVCPADHQNRGRPAARPPTQRSPTTGRTSVDGDPTRQTKGRTGDCPGRRKETAPQRSHGALIWPLPGQYGQACHQRPPPPMESGGAVSY